MPSSRPLDGMQNILPKGSWNHPWWFFSPHMLLFTGVARGLHFQEVFLLFFLPTLFCLTSKSGEQSYSCETLRHAQPCGHTTCDTQTSGDERCCPPLWLDDGSARMGTWNSSMAWSTALGFPSPDSHAATLNRNLIIKSKVSVSLRVRLTEPIDFEGKLLCIWIL